MKLACFSLEVFSYLTFDYILMYWILSINMILILINCSLCATSTGCSLCCPPWPRPARSWGCWWSSSSSVSSHSPGANINIFTTRPKHLLLLNTYLARFSLIYFAEKESAARWSFPDSFWWGLMVLTTVIVIMIMIMMNSIHLRIIWHLECSLH